MAIQKFHLCSGRFLELSSKHNAQDPGICEGSAIGLHLLNINPAAENDLDLKIALKPCFCKYQC